MEWDLLHQIGWLRSYVYWYIQCVEYDGIWSSMRETETVVPQSLIRSSLLFIIYMNGKYTICDNLILIIYADDTTK